MLKPVVSAMLLVLALSSCATNPPAPVKPVATQRPALSPPPAEVMIPRSANYLNRLCAIFASLSATQIEMCANLPPAKQ